MSDKTVKTIAIALLVVACSAGAATISYFIQQRRVVALEATLAADRASSEGLRARLARIEAELASATAPTATPAEPAEPADGSTGKPPAKPTGTPAPDASETKTTRQFAFVRKASMKGSTLWLSLDYAEFLTDPVQVEAAAKAAGDEYPTPNDYYISNTAAKLREFPVADDAAFTIALYGPDDTEKLTPAEFRTAFVANDDQVADAGYWLTIVDGVVTSAEEQWTP